jgi:hypothetical protein
MLFEQLYGRCFSAQLGRESGTQPGRRSMCLTGGSSIGSGIGAAVSPAGGLRLQWSKYQRRIGP